MKKIPLLIFVFALLTAPRFGYGLEQWSPDNSKFTSGTTVEGTVMYVNEGFAEIQINDKSNTERTYKIQDVLISGQNGALINLSDLKPGNSVILEIGTDGRVKRVQTTN